MKYNQWPFWGKIAALAWWTFWSSISALMVALGVAMRKIDPMLTLLIGFVGWIIFMTGPDVFYLMYKWVLANDDQELRFKRTLILAPFGVVAGTFLLFLVTELFIFSLFVMLFFTALWIWLSRPREDDDEENPLHVESE